MQIHSKARIKEIYDATNAMADAQWSAYAIKGFGEHHYSYAQP